MMTNNRYYLGNFEDIYKSYAAGMWTLGIRSTEMIAILKEEDLARVLAHPVLLPDLAHQIHATDMIARCVAARQAGILVEGSALTSVGHPYIYDISTDHGYATDQEFDNSMTGLF